MVAARKFSREHVARVCLEALEQGLPLIETVREVMDVDFNQARYMIRRVREEGLLGTTPHLPARAMIHRGTRFARAWVVCTQCLARWPCADAYPYAPPLLGGDLDEETP